MTVPTCWTKEKSRSTALSARTDQDECSNDCASTIVRATALRELENVNLSENSESEPEKATMQVSEGGKQHLQQEPPN